MRCLAVVGVLALGCEDYGHFHRDLATPEVEDLAAPLVDDLADTVDLARPPDQAMPRDFATARDFARPPDLDRPRDLVAPPDLASPAVDQGDGAIPDLGTAADGNGMGRKSGPGEPCDGDQDCEGNRSCKMVTIYGNGQDGFAAWTLLGDAKYTKDNDNPRIVLTPGGTWKTGGLVYPVPLSAAAFTITFEFAMGGGSPGDGMAFFLSPGDRPIALGKGGGGLGVAGLTGFAVEFDSYRNLKCDPWDDHVAIDELTACDNDPPTHVIARRWPADLRDGRYHSCTITGAAGTLSVASVDNFAPNPPLSAVLPALRSGTYYFGFAAATGTATDAHRVRNIAVTIEKKICF